MGYVLRGEGHEREAFRLVYKRRLENLGFKLQESGQGKEANTKQGNQSRWPKMKTELLVKEISELHQERHELRRETRQLQKRGLTEASLVENQLDAAKRGTQHTRERRDALKKLLAGSPKPSALSLAGDVLQVEESLSKKVEALRKETQGLTERREELERELQESHSSQAQLSGQVTFELRQAAAQQAHSCTLQVELKLWRDKLRKSEMDREELHGQHLQVAMRLQTTLALARKEAENRLVQLKQRLQQEDDAADCLGEAGDQKQVQVDAANEQLRQMDHLAKRDANDANDANNAANAEADVGTATSPVKSKSSRAEDELKSSLSNALSQIDDLKRMVHDIQAEKTQLLRLASAFQSEDRWQKICSRFRERQATRSASDWKEEIEKMRGLLASQPPPIIAAAAERGVTGAVGDPGSTEPVAQRVLEAFNEEVPCHSMDLASLLMGADDAYVVSAVTQLIQAEVKRQASAIQASLLQTRRPGRMEELVGRVQELQKQLLLEVVSSSEDEDEEIRDLELHLALLVGRRDEVLRR